MGRTQDTKPADRQRAEDRQTLVRYTALTAILFIPSLLAFASIRNLYPFAASTMMVSNRDLQSSRDYYVLRGENISGETIDLPPIHLTNALTGRNWSLVSATIKNQSFNIRWPNPTNITMTSAYGGSDKLPRAARLEELLRAWGAIYNSRLPESSNQRLRFVRLDAYRWEGGINGEYYRFVETWRAKL